MPQALKPKSCWGPGGTAEGVPDSQHALTKTIVRPVPAKLLRAPRLAHYNLCVAAVLRLILG